MKMKKLLLGLIFFALGATSFAGQVDEYTIPDSPLTMVELQTRLEALFEAAASSNRGSSAPANPFQGMMWWDTSLDPVEHLRRYTAAAGWVSLVSINNTTGAVLTFGGRAPGGSTAGDFLTNNATQNFPGKTSTDGFRITGGALTIGGNTEYSITPTTAAGRHYILIGSSGGSRIAVYGGSDSTAPGQIILSGYDGSLRSGVIISADGKVNLPVGLQIGGVSVAAPITTTVVDSGDFTGTVYLAKSGRNVTMTWGAMSHSSSVNPSSAAGAIPAAYRPVTDTNALTIALSGSVRQVLVYGTGTFTFYSRDWAGSDAAVTTTGRGSISWVSAN